MGFVSIIAQIKIILDGIADIGEVFLFDKGKFERYPAVVIYPSENINDFNTTTQNLTEYVFTIRIHQIMNEAGDDSHEKADRILREVVDQIITEFDKKANLSLGGTVKWTKATPSTWAYQTRESGAMRVAEITISANALVDIG